jgi:hypothetical protein
MGTTHASRKPATPTTPKKPSPWKKVGERFKKQSPKEADTLAERLNRAARDAKKKRDADDKTRREHLERQKQDQQRKPPKNTLNPGAVNQRRREHPDGTASPLSPSSFADLVTRYYSDDDAPPTLITTSDRKGSLR